MFENMLTYVDQILTENYAQGSSFANKHFPFRKRIDHIERVLMWSNRILETVDATKEVVQIAAIFHDVGYAITIPNKEIDNKLHGLYSEMICRKYLETTDYNTAFINQVCHLIKHHSNKQLLKDTTTSIEQIVLLEADLLDETGAMSIVWDCMLEGNCTEQDFTKTYNHIQRYSSKILENNPMVTDYSKKIWRNKQKLVTNFLESFHYDLMD